MGEEEPTGFEAAILAWIVAHTQDPLLAAQLAGVRVLHRKSTGAGCYTQLRLRDDAPATSEPYGARGPLAGPNFESPAVEHGGGTLLWFHDGRAETLEIYAYGDGFPADHAEMGAFVLAGGSPGTGLSKAD